ncbi:MAG: VWA domain-containing protein, partial [Anaerolineae bacterium]|nr:VWA domain-containing protein [Anaerolineae bacterium]
MAFLNPLGLLGFLFVIPLIALYLLRRHYPDVAVPSLRLWESLLQDRRADRPWKKLKRTWLLILQLLVLTLIVISLTRPVIPGSVTGGDHLIILLDVSASMAVQDADGTSRFAHVVQQVYQRISASDGTADISLIVVDNHPHIVVTGVNQLGLKRAVSELSPTHGTSDWVTAAQLAHGLFNPADQDKVTTILASDFAFHHETALSPSDFPGALVIIRAGGSTNNVGIVHFATRRQEPGFRIFLRISNAGPAAERTLEILADGRILQQQTVQLDSYQDSVVNIHDVNAQQWIEARLLEEDAFPLDNRVWAAVDGGVPGKIYLITEGNRFLSEALGNLPSVDLTQSTGFVAGDESSQSYSTIVVDGLPVSVPEGVNRWLIAPETETACGRPGEEVAASDPIQGEWQHILLRYVDWSDVYIGRLRTYDLPPDAELLLTSGTTPVLWALRRDGYRAVCMAFKLQDSDLALRLAFPILTSNIMEWLTQTSSGEPDSPLQPGDRWIPDLSPAAASAALTDQDNHQMHVPLDGSSVILDAVGLYRFEVSDPNGVRTYHVAVSLLDPEESDLKPRSPLIIANSTGIEEGLGYQGQREISRWFVLLAGILCCLEAVGWLWGKIPFNLGAVAGYFSQSGHKAALVLRVVLLISLAGAFLGIRLHKPVRDLGIVVVVDRSDSTRERWQNDEMVIREILDKKKPGDQVAVIAFGAQAYVERAMSPDADFTTVHSQPDRHATDIEQALRLAMGILPTDLFRRIILFSDGVQTHGDSLTVIKDAQASGINVMLVNTGTRQTWTEAWIEDIKVPSLIYPGDRVPIQIKLGTNRVQAAGLNWSAGSNA